MKMALLSVPRDEMVKRHGFESSTVTKFTRQTQTLAPEAHVHH